MAPQHKGQTQLVALTEYLQLPPPVFQEFDQLRIVVTPKQDAAEVKAGSDRKTVSAIKRHLSINDRSIVVAKAFDDLRFLIDTITNGVPEESQRRFTERLIEYRVDPTLDHDVGINVEALVVLRKKSVGMKFVPPRRDPGVAFP
jgi:hypothetical protein